ncbi:MAG: radical SAM family heme chaperone HemW [Dehalococcoidia bacterium]|nr:radical SAM family heme chaperone HemW [Dehalococcoidia bacterium]
MKPLAVYVHIPFCTVKCGYCDFNAYAGLHTLRERYTAALLREVAQRAELLGGREVRSIAFGGGTPNELPAADISAIVAAIRAAAGAMAAGAEVSLEANPGITGAGQLHELRRGGVTRISFGVQSFDADELRFLDRLHSPEASAAVVGAARHAGFESVGIDLIYGLPGQSFAGWEANLRRAVAAAPDHISCYALTIEEGTPLAARVERGEVTPADGDLVADMYERAGDLLEAAGYRQYELSNWARPGHESRHNRTYWTDGEYLGLGAGAHGYVDGVRYEDIAHPRTYIEALEAGRGAVAAHYRPDDITAMSDWLALRLRLIEGFDPGDFKARFGTPLEAAAGPVIARFREAGVLDAGPRARLSPRGRQLHSEVAVQLLVHLREHAPAAARP